MNENQEYILTQAQLLYNVKLIRENTNGGSGNKIFEVKSEIGEYILRVANFTRKVKERTEFELEWLDYLGAKTENIAMPVKSVNNNLYEVINVNDQAFIMCLFEKALGKNPDSSNSNEFNENLFYKLGAVMGDLHRLTASYKGNVVKPKFQWDNEAYSWRGNYPISDTQVSQCEGKLLRKINALPIASHCYGIIHYDIHIDNFFVHDDKIKLFDFCECQFNWYAADIASAIFFMVQKGAGPLSNKSEAERTAYAQAYITAYLQGYLTTNIISKFWINKIDLFIKYQMTDEYRCTQYFWKDDPLHSQEWYLQWFKDRLVNDLPYVYVDYNAIIKALPPIPD